MEEYDLAAGTDAALHEFLFCYQEDGGPAVAAIEGRRYRMGDGFDDTRSILHPAGDLNGFDVGRPGGEHASSLTIYNNRC